eukprot:scaffold61124_cov21-Prasinocladus_malaysianus.AAC.1
MQRLRRQSRQHRAIKRNNHGMPSKRLNHLKSMAKWLMIRLNEEHKAIPVDAVDRIEKTNVSS